MEQRICKIPVIEDNEDGGSAPPLPPLILSKTVEMEIKKKAFEVAKEFGYLIEEGKYADRTPGTMCRVNFPDEIAKVRRHDRKVGADFFRRAYTYLSATDNSREQKTCIWPDNSYSWLDKSSGIMWVGVHGKESICVVTRAGDLDLARVSGLADDWPQHVILEQFRKSVIDEIEDLTDLSSELRKKFNKSIEKPFGVVCVIPGTDESHKESGYLGYDEKEAIKFLKEAVKSDAAFSIDKTIRTAISGLQLLFQKKFKANEIEVSVMDPNYRIRDFEEKDLTIEVLPIRRVKDHLAVINELCFKDKEPTVEDLKMFWIQKDMAARGISPPKKKKANP